eukprot:6279558-Amphidinium_carterae.1
MDGVRVLYGSSVHVSTASPSNPCPQDVPNELCPARNLSLYILEAVVTATPASAKPMPGTHPSGRLDRVTALIVAKTGLGTLLYGTAMQRDTPHLQVARRLHTGVKANVASPMYLSTVVQTGSHPSDLSIAQLKARGSPFTKISSKDNLHHV